MRSLVDTVMSAADASQNETSSIVDARYIFKASAQAIVTGSAAGTLQMQCSNDIPAGYPNAAANEIPSHWSNLGSSVAISGAGTYIVPAADISYQYLRVIYTFTSGTGSITINLKSLGF